MGTSINSSNKPGLSLKITSCLIYLLAFFGGWTTLVLVTGFMLLYKHSNDQFKFDAVRALLLTVGFALLGALIRILPDLFGIINSICNVFDGDGIRALVINDLVSMFDTWLDYGEKYLFILLAVFSFFGKFIKLGPVDKLANAILPQTTQTVSKTQVVKDTSTETTSEE